jgi:hypothetical protein
MSQTRRETLVAVLQGTNNYSINELNAMNDIVGDFLTQAENAGESHKSLADKLVAFKDNGGAGLANAIAAITGNGFGSSDANDEFSEALAQAKTALEEAIRALDAVS